MLTTILPGLFFSACIFTFLGLVGYGIARAVKAVLRLVLSSSTSARALQCECPTLADHTIETKLAELKARAANVASLPRVNVPSVTSQRHSVAARAVVDFTRPQASSSRTPSSVTYQASYAAPSHDYCVAVLAYLEAETYRSQRAKGDTERHDARGMNSYDARRWLRIASAVRQGLVLSPQARVEVGQLATRYRKQLARGGVVSAAN